MNRKAFSSFQHNALNDRTFARELAVSIKQNHTVLMEQHTIITVTSNASKFYSLNVSIITYCWSITFLNINRPQNRTELLILHFVLA